MKLVAFHEYKKNSVPGGIFLLHSLNNKINQMLGTDCTKCCLLLDDRKQNEKRKFIKIITVNVGELLSVVSNYFFMAFICRVYAIGSTQQRK